MTQLIQESSICHQWIKYYLLYCSLIWLSQYEWLTYLQLNLDTVVNSRYSICILIHYMNGLVQERRKSSALSMELRLACTNPLIWYDIIVFLLFSLGWHTNCQYHENQVYHMPKHITYLDTNIFIHHHFIHHKHHIVIKDQGQTYPQTSNISHMLVDNKIVYHSNVVGASPVGPAPTTSPFLT